MLSHIVTAARGIFGRQDQDQDQDNTAGQILEEDHRHHQQQREDIENEIDTTTTNTTITPAAGISSDTRLNMVIATRRTVFSKSPAEDSECVDVAAVKNSPKPTKTTTTASTKGKRKIAAEPVAEEEGGRETQSPKRRKKRSLDAAESARSMRRRSRTKEDVEDVEDANVDGMDESNESLEPVVANGPGNKVVEKPESKAKSTHVRFDSEEPALPEIEGRNLKPVVEIITNGTSGKDEEEEEESDDDEAPEALDNATQFKKIKEIARKELQVKQKTSHLKRVKRRERDQRLKTQALNKVPTKDPTPPSPSKDNDLLSESSATLQGSVAMDVKIPSRLTLPALLPDEILNSTPSIRPPTPPPEQVGTAIPSTAFSRKFKLLESTTKRPRDLRLGTGKSIRVLDSPSTGSSSNNFASALPPKSSKASRGVKESWMKNNTSGVVGGGLRRTTGGSSGFLRR
ncbi:hypothetical protein AJ80_05451 [Polytolypa hystricis UAMH7299]|uniref:Immediate-early protein n=1 Tax=Polytolypa hystricis (strain UAMH7299) TaxID=1447883 RepID=A0A2B7Y3Y3_POLH7|nr:hypothetical protein AJ80_05451 [Polytolypa hystricis UAMH7299]